VPKTITYEYDEFGKVSKIKYPNYHHYDPNIPGDDPNEYGFIGYTYSDRTLGECGMVATIIDCRTDPNHPGGNGPTYEFEYDIWSGNLNYYTNADGFKISYNYNLAWNRKTSVAVNEPNDPNYPDPDQAFYHVQYRYDLAGRMMAVDANDFATQTMQPVAGFAYDANGNRGQMTYHLSRTGAGPIYYINYAYNADNLLTNITTSGGSAFSYEAQHSGDIDGLGRLRQSHESIAWPSGNLREHDYNFVYDMLSELLSAQTTHIDSYEYVRETFAYNLDGNVNSHGCYTKLSGQNETGTADTYAYLNNGDIMSGATGTNNPFTLSNDNNGNITKLPTTEPNGVNWNYDNKLKNAYKGTSSIAVKYDPMGNRIWRLSTVNGVTTGRKYIVDISGELPTILCEIDTSTSSLKTSYIYADGQILSQRIHDSQDPNLFTPYYYVHDRLGSIRLMINSEGTAVNSYTYSPYGKDIATECTGTTENHFKFTGQWYDAEIEQYYLRARQYDPQMMRFTSRDPMRGKYQEPMSLHRYLYCQNDGVNHIDPSGKILGYVDLLLSSALEANLRKWDYKVHMDIFKKARKELNAFSLMNLERGLTYDLLIADYEGTLQKTLRDGGIKAFGQMSENFENYSRYLGYAAKVYDNRKALRNILTGEGNAENYYDIAEAIMGSVVGNL
jgi:RHS repeat-associated protein